jgi:hypothetical protein
MSETTLEEVTSKLMNKWVMTEQVNKTWNGMAISHNRQEGVLTISMKRDIEAMLIQFGMAECKPMWSGNGFPSRGPQYTDTMSVYDISPQVQRT